MIRKADSAPRTKRKKNRKTPPPPLCPVHGVRMLVRHASSTRQYRYCTVAGCDQTCQSNRVFRLSNAMCLWYGGETNAAGNLRLSPGLCQ